MMHPAGPPILSDSSSDDRLGRSEPFAVAPPGQVGDLKRPHLVSILPRTVLREADRPAVEGENSTRRPGNSGIVPDYGTLRMLFPRPFKLRRTVQTERLVREGGVAREHPPSVSGTEDRWIGMRSLDQRADDLPIEGEIPAFVKADLTRTQSLRNHIVTPFPLENTRVGKME